MKKKPAKRAVITKARGSKSKRGSAESTIASLQAIADRLAAGGTKTYLKPVSKPAALWVSNGNGRELSHTGKLQLTLARNETHIAIDQLVPFGENEIEQKLIQLIHTTKPNLFAGYKDPLKALFLLRAIHIPTVCRGLIHKANATEESIIWLGALGAYSVAFERTLFERLYRAKLQAGLFPKSEEKFENWDTTFFGLNILKWFDATKEGYGFWLSRFDQWLEYALHSLDHYLGCQSIDYRTQVGEMKQASHMGILKNLDALPVDRVSAILDEIYAAKETRKMFQKNAKKRRTSPPNLAFESWLIECWPLVLEYGWNYRELQLVANKRFEDDQVKFDKTAESIKAYCQNLNLTLGKGRNKVGRCKASEESLFPQMFEVALRIDGLDDPVDWFWGKADSSFNIFKDFAGHI